MTWSIKRNDGRDRWEVRDEDHVYDWADSQIGAVNIVRELVDIYTADADRADGEADRAREEADELKAAVTALNALLKKELSHDR
jgi:hypothetical protein